jgi:hypothetical protein
VKNWERSWYFVKHSLSYIRRSSSDLCNRPSSPCGHSIFPW